MCIFISGVHTIWCGTCYWTPALPCSLLLSLPLFYDVLFMRAPILFGHTCGCAAEHWPSVFDERERLSTSLWGATLSSLCPVKASRAVRKPECTSYPCPSESAWSLPMCVCVCAYGTRQKVAFVCTRMNERGSWRLHGLRLVKLLSELVVSGKCCSNASAELSALSPGLERCALLPFRCNFPKQLHPERGLQRHTKALACVRRK